MANISQLLLLTLPIKWILDIGVDAGTGRKRHIRHFIAHAQWRGPFLFQFVVQATLGHSQSQCKEQTLTKQERFHDEEWFCLVYDRCGCLIATLWRKTRIGKDKTILVGVGVRDLI